MAKFFRYGTRETTIISKIESSKQHSRRKAVRDVKDHIDNLSNSISMKLVENSLIETTSKDALQEQIGKCLEKLGRLNDFEIDYSIAPYRQVAKNPHPVSLFVTSFVLEKMINHKSVVDIFGTDDEIYSCIDKQVRRYLPI
jgi:hypothetical protein